MFILFIVIYIAIALFMIVAMWKVYEKANQPGWASIVPIYNIYVMTQMAEKPVWWFVVILLVPIANIVFLIMMYDVIAKKFGKESAFTVGLVLLPIVFWPILGYGSATYEGGSPKNDPRNEVLDQNL